MQGAFFKRISVEISQKKCSCFLSEIPTKHRDSNTTSTLAESLFLFNFQLFSKILGSVCAYNSIGYMDPTVVCVAFETRQIYNLNFEGTGTAPIFYWKSFSNNNLGRERAWCGG